MKKIEAKELSYIVPKEIAEAAIAAGIEPGELVGKGEGLTIRDDGIWDFGQCGFCGVGHYVSEPGCLCGVCDNCGAI